MDVETDAYALISAVGSTSLTLTQLVIFSIHIKRCLNFIRSTTLKAQRRQMISNVAERYRKLSHLLTVLTLLIYVIHGIWLSLDALGVLSYLSCVWTKRISAALYHIGKVSLYCVLSTRLMVGFSESSFKKSIRRVSNFLYIFSILFLCIALFGDLSFISGHLVISEPNLHMRWCALEQMPQWGVVIFFTTDVIISLVALTAFMYPLRQLIQMTYKIEMTSKQNNNNNNNNGHIISDSKDNILSSSTGGAAGASSVGSIGSVGSAGSGSGQLHITVPPSPRSFSGNDNNHNRWNSADMGSNDTIRGNINGKDNKNKPTGPNAGILNLLQRYTFLTFTALFGTVVFVVAINYLLVSWFLLADNVINALCIILMSSFYNDWYEKLCCCSKWKICSCGLAIQKTMTMQLSPRGVKRQEPKLGHTDTVEMDNKLGNESHLQIPESSPIPQKSPQQFRISTQSQNEQDIKI